MFCKNCGNEVKEGRFCPNCGTEVAEPENKVSVEGPAIKEVKVKYDVDSNEKSGRREKFAVTGFIFGIISLITSIVGNFIPPLPVLGLVFSGLGKKSEKEDKAKTGFGLSLAGLIIGMVQYIISLLFVFGVYCSYIILILVMYSFGAY